MNSADKGRKVSSGNISASFAGHMSGKSAQKPVSQIYSDEVLATRGEYV
jgi:hypothetical protein